MKHNSFCVASSDHRRHLPQTDCLLLSFVLSIMSSMGEREFGESSTLSGAGASQERERERHAKWQQALAREEDRRQKLSNVPHSHAHCLLLPFSRSATTRFDARCCCSLACVFVCACVTADAVCRRLIQAPRVRGKKDDAMAFNNDH